MIGHLKIVLQATNTLKIPKQRLISDYVVDSPVTYAL